ncbi:MAG: hypothetical protein HFH41_05020 [Lachnospiraceae bacterium]|nr:hypothetical protein [Lachnospiraceae bacterium]
MGRLVIDGNSVYEIDEECIRQKERREKEQQREIQERRGEMRNGRRSRRGYFG